MPIEILMPALSPTMTEGNLAKWLKKEGDKVKSGEVIAEIETDKATMEVEAVDEGVIGKIIVPAGTEGVAVNALIALLLEEGEDKKVLENYAPAAKAPEKKPEEKKPEAVAPALAPVEAKQGGRVFASPLAKRVAADLGVSLGSVTGTGPHGRIIRADVESAPAGGRRQRARNPVEAKEIPNSNMRKIIAKRLLESKQTIPHFYLSVDCELDRLLAARKALNEAAEAKAGKGGKPAYKLSVNDFVIKAVAAALRDIPASNASWTETAVLQYNNVDVSVAVAVESGLVTPIIRNADFKNLREISAEMKELAVKAREGRLKPEEFQGGGFTISNLGMYGVKNFSAILNPPQAGILAVGAGEERAVVKNGQLSVANVMSCTLSCDHRVIDGAVGAEFLAAFKRFIEEPVLMLAEL